MDETTTKPRNNPPSHWLLSRLTEKSTWSGVGLVILCTLILLGIPILKLVAWIGLIYGIYSIFSAEKTTGMTTRV
jgi:hypothetical protein